MKKCIFLFILPLLFSGCVFFIDPLPNLWFYTYSEGLPGERDSALTPVAFLELRKDGSYTRDFGRFEYGTWTRKGKTLLLTNQDHNLLAIPVRRSQPRQLLLALSDHYAAGFESQPMARGGESEDPFSKANNLWRIPATAKETDAQLRQRLNNHCRFWEVYFKWALDREFTTIDVRSTPTPIKIYGNGFGLKEMENLPAAWKGYFYDSADCRRANEMIRQIFESHSIAWAHTDNKYKFFIAAFQQLEDKLK